MDFSAFKTTEMDDYAAQAKALYGKTDAYKEFEQKTKGKSKEQMNWAGEQMMELFVEFGQMMKCVPRTYRTYTLPYTCCLALRMVQTRDKNSCIKT